MAAKFVNELLGKVTIDTTQPEKALPGINQLIKALEAELREASKEAARLSGALASGDKDSKAYAEAKQQIRGVKAALSELNTMKKALKLVEPGDVEGIKKIHKEVTALAAVITGMERRSAVEAGKFGLNPKTVREGVNSLKDLQKAAQEARADVVRLGDESRLKKLEAAITRNTKKLTEQVAVLKEEERVLKQAEALRRKIDKDHSTALVMNREFDRAKAGGASPTEIAAQRQISSIVSAMDLREKMRSAELGNFGLDPKTLREGTKNLQELERTAKRVRAEINQFGDTERLQKFEQTLAQNKRGIQERIEALRTEAQAIKDRAKAAKDAATAGLTEEQIRDKQIREAAQKRMGLIGGVGGASLMAVQASLMANYGILQGLVNSITGGVRNAIELEAAFRNIQAVTVTTSQEMRGLEKQIKDVAASSKFSSVEVAQAALILGQAGLNAKQTGEALKAVATLAVASGTSIAESVDLVTSVIGVFDKKANDAVDVINKITAASNSSKINVERMTLAFQYVGNTAAQMGISFEETTAAIAAMSNAGIKSGSTMGTGLRAFLTETQKPSEEFIKIITNLGLSLSDLDFKAHGLMGVARKLRESGFIASDAIKSFDVRSAAAFNAMVANPEDLERQYKLLLDTNAGLEAEKIQMESLQSQSQRLRTSLQNLAATGFAPLGKVLTGVASGLATLFQAMSEWETVVGAVGTAIAIGLTAGVAKYTLSLALGAAATLGLTKATAASVASMTAGTFATQVITKAKAAYTTATAAATVSTLSLSGAVRLLSSVSIFGALGLAVGVATAAFMAYQHVSGSTKRRTEELRAALDNSKGAYEEQVGVIQSLNDKIEELEHKSDTLAGSQKDVQMMGMALEAQFGKEGFASDKLATSFAKQADQLRKLRDLKEQSAKQSLDLARLDAQAMVDDQEKNFAKDFGLVRQRGVASRGLDMVLGGPEAKHLNESQLSVLREMRDALVKGDPRKPGPLASSSEILRILALKTKDDSFFGGRSRSIREASEELGGASLLATNVRQAREEKSSLDFKAEQQKAAESFAGARIFGGMTFAQAMKEVKGTGIEQNIIASGAAMGANGRTDPIKLHTLAMEQTRKSLARLSEIEKVLEEQRINTTDEALLSNLVAQRTKVNAAQEAIRVSMDRLTDQTQPAAERIEKARKAAADGTDRQKNKDASAAAIRQNALAEAQFKFRGIIDPDKQRELIEGELRGGEQRATNVRNIGPTTTIRQFRLAEQLALKEAENAQRDANLSGSEEAAKVYMEMGMAARARAREAAFQQLKAKLKEDAAVGGSREGLSQRERDLEIANFNASEDEKDREFLLKFTGFANVAQANLQRVRAATNELRQDLLDLQNSNQQGLYNSGARARELQERFDVNTQMGDPRGENLILERTLKRELVNVDKQYLVSKHAELDLEDKIIENAERELAMMEATLRVTEERVAELQKIHDLGAGFMSDAEKQEFIAAKARLEPERTELRNQRALVAGARRQRIDTQRDLFTTRSRIRGNMMPEIQEVNIENVGRAMDDVWAKWQNITANMDIIRTMREGFGGTVNSITGSLGEMFMKISTGTRSVTGSFKDMAVSVIQSIMQITTQLLAMYAVQQMVGLVQSLAGALGGAGGTVSGSAIGTAPGSIFSGSSFNPSSIALPMPLGAEGGYMLPSGFFERAQFLAGGGPVYGGVAGRDSVPAMLMPGEFVVQKRAVDVVGTDFLHGLNSQASGIARQAPVKAEVKSDNRLLNIWVVSPDAAQQQTTTPNDIVVAVSDNISRGGTIKQLIKQINLGVLP